jgi:hypothetical protein
MQDAFAIVFASLAWILPSAFLLCEVVPGFWHSDRRMSYRTEDAPMSSFIAETRDYRGNPAQEKKMNK